MAACTLRVQPVRKLVTANHRKHTFASPGGAAPPLARKPRAKKRDDFRRLCELTYLSLKRGWRGQFVRGYVEKVSCILRQI